MLGGCLTVIITFVMFFVVLGALFYMLGEVMAWVAIIAIPIAIGWVVVKIIKAWKERNNK